MMGYNGAGVIDGTSNPADEREPIDEDFDYSADDGEYSRSEEL